MTNSMPFGTVCVLQCATPGIGPKQTPALPGAQPSPFGRAYADSSTGSPLTRSRPFASQHSTTSPGTPTTRFTRWPPDGYSPTLVSAWVSGLDPWATSSGPSQPPGSLKTTTSPRCGVPPNQYDGFSTRIRSFFTSPGSIDSEGM